MQKAKLESFEKELFLSVFTRSFYGSEGGIGGEVCVTYKLRLRSLARKLLVVSVYVSLFSSFFLKKKEIYLYLVMTMASKKLFFFFEN